MSILTLNPSLKFLVMIITVPAITLAGHQGFGKSKNLKKETSMKITAVSISGSNASMGPHEVKSEKTTDVTKHPKELDDLLDNTKINGVVTLRELLQIHVDDNKEEMQKVRDAYKIDNMKLSVGGRVYSFNVYFKDHSPFKTGDTRYWQISGEGYNRFLKLHEKAGTVQEWPGDLNPAKIENYRVKEPTPKSKSKPQETRTKKE